MTDTKNKLFFGDLSHKLAGILFNVPNELGRLAREKQYGDLIEKKLSENKFII